MIDAKTGIWSIKEAGQNHFFDEPLIKAIAELFPTPPSRTADLGCGKGYYCRYLDNLGWPNVDGYEGTPNIKRLAVYEGIKQADLSKPLDVKEKYELVICLEVGEHIPPRREADFIRNLNRLTINTLILSWAIPGQTGLGHVNCKTNNYVVNKIQDCGFTLNPVISSKLREVSTLPWFKNTVFFFSRL